jgi:hypothetical protein
LKRLNVALTSIKGSWQNTSRGQALVELENLLVRQHEIELQVEKIDNMYLREYAHQLLDKMASARRSLGEEIRWDIKAGRSMN